MNFYDSIKSLAEHRPEFSIIIPCYKCSESLDELKDRLVKTLESIGKKFEIILVNDASPESDWEIISKMAQEDKRIKGLNLSKNFGEYYAITAGLDFARGNWVVLMDGDLQDTPEEIPNLYKKAVEGYDIVYARRNERQDNIFKKLSSTIFYKVFSYLTETEQDKTINNFGIYNSKAIKVIKTMREKSRFFPVLIKWVGFKSTSIDIEHHQRKYGETSYSFKKLLDLAFDTMIAFSDKPLKLTVKLGFSIVLISFIYAIFLSIKYFMGFSDVRGWPSLMVSIWFFSGLIVMILGIIGIYVGKIFDEVKNRPIYVIKDVLNVNLSNNEQY